MNDLVKAWGWLVALSLSTTVIASITNGAGAGFAAVVLILSGWKARVILGSYLGLKNSRYWSRGFNSFIGFFIVVAFGIYSIPLWAGMG